MSDDSQPTTPTPKSTYSFRMTPARHARLTQTPQPRTRPTRKTPTPHPTPSCQPTPSPNPPTPANPSSSSTASPTPLPTPSRPLDPTSRPSVPTRSTHCTHTTQPPAEETPHLTRCRHPSRLTTSISAIPRLTSQLLSALTGPLITPRNITTDILRTLLRNTLSPSPSISSPYPPTPSSPLTQIPPPPINTIPIPLLSSSRANLHNISTVVDSLFSSLIPTLATHPLLPFRYLSVTTSKSTQTDSYYLCPTCEWQPLSYPLTQDEVNLQGTLITRLQTYLGGIPNIIREHCGLYALRTTAHLLKILPTLIVYPLLPVILECIDSPDRDRISHGRFPTSLLHPLLLLQNTLVATFRLYLLSALFLPLSYFTPRRHFPHVLFSILGCLREAILHLFHEIPHIVQTYYTIRSLTLFCTITQFGDLIITRETRLLSVHLEQYYFATYLQHIPPSSFDPPSSNNVSPPPSPTTLHRLYTPSALPHITTFSVEHLYNAYHNPTITTNLINLDQYVFFAYTAYTNTAALHPATIPCSLSHSSSHHLSHPSTPPTTSNPTCTPQSESPPVVTPTSLSSTMAPPSNSSSQRGHIVDRATQSTTPRSNPVLSPRSTSHQENTSHPPDNMTHAIATAMDHLWQTRIQPSLEQQRDDNRQSLADMQIQLDSVRRSVTDSIHRLSSTSRPSAPPHTTPTQFSPPHSPILSSLRDNESPSATRTSRIRWEDNPPPPPPPRDSVPPPSPQTFYTSSRQRNHRSVDLLAFLKGTSNPLLTEDDLERFSRQQPEKLTDYQIRAFADQLERYLSADPANHEFIAESAALRKLIQCTKPSLLGAWLQLYTNTNIQFSYCKTLFWRRKYDENAHRCIPRPHRGPDMTECLERLTRTIEDHFPPTNRQQGNSNSQQRPQNNNNYRPTNQRPYDNNQNRNFQPQYPQNYQPRNDNNRNNGNQQNYNRNDQNRNNNQNYSPIANPTNNNNNTPINNPAHNMTIAKITILTNNPSAPTIKTIHHKTSSKTVHNNNRTNAPTTMIIATILRAILIHDNKTPITVTINIDKTT